MKVAILTFSHTSNMNYGAMLQSYALYTVLKKVGFTPYIIRWNMDKFSFDDIEYDTIFGFTKKIARRTLGVLYYRCMRRVARLFGESPFKKFFLKHFENTTGIYTKNKLHRLNNYFDRFVVGSDQVWRYKTCPDIESFFLSFVDDDKTKVSYAASFGIDKWNEAPQYVTKRIKSLISRFDCVTIREDSGVEICRDVFQVNASWVSDPTLLLFKEDYYKLMDEDTSAKNSSDSKYVACMFLEDQKQYQDFYSELSNHTGLNCVQIKGENVHFLSFEFTKYNSIARWLRYINNAEFVLTDSFHCAAISILLNKKIAVIKHSVRGNSRLESLLRRYHMSNLLFDSLEEALYHEPWIKEIDYTGINRQIKEDRENSIQILKQSLVF